MNFLECLQKECRFADPGFSGQQDDLPRDETLPDDAIEFLYVGRKPFFSLRVDGNIYEFRSREVGCFI